MRYFNNPEAFMKLMASMQSGIVATLTIFFATLVFSIPLGMVIALLRMNRRRIISLPVSLYILVMRGTPLMLQIFAIYFAIPMLTGTNLNRMTATILAFSLNYAAYFAEIFRGGIMAIPVGQHEACQVLGFTKMQTFFHVVLPQVAKRVLLPVSNEVITLVKDTSLSRIIALQEIIWAGQAFLKGTQGISGAIWPLFFTGIYYLIFSGLLTLALGKLEKKLDYFKA